MGKPLGKTKKKCRFIQKESDWFDSDAYRDLNCTARCLIDEFLNIYRPNRNGQLSISTRKAAKLLSVSENTAIKAFRDLVEHGFLILSNHHCWTQGKAREYELTVREEDGRTAKNSWQIWKPGNPVTKLPVHKNSRPQKLRHCTSKFKALVH